MRKCVVNSSNHLQMDCWKFPNIINTSPRQYTMLPSICRSVLLSTEISTFSDTMTCIAVCSIKSRRMIIEAETLMKLVKICQGVWIFRSYLQEIRKMPPRCFPICDRNMAELENDTHVLLSWRGHKRPISLKVWIERHCRTPFPSGYWKRGYCLLSQHSARLGGIVTGNTRLMTT